MNQSINSESQAITRPVAVTAQSLLQDARQALKTGDRKEAYRLSLEATRRSQGDQEAWVIRARAAASSEERLLCLSQAVQLDPDHPVAKQELYVTLMSQLNQDPFLAYLDETGQVYFVRNTGYQTLAVPKDRGTPETYPSERPEALAKAYRRLGWAVLGLAPAGLGALVFAPLAFFQAVSALGQPIQKPDRVRAWLAAWLSILLFAVSLALALLLLIHFVG